MVVRPMTVTLLSRRQPPASVTSGPITQNGPISTSSAILALGSMTAEGWTFGISSLKNRKLNRPVSQRGARRGASFGLGGSFFKPVAWASSPCRPRTSSDTGRKPVLRFLYRLRVHEHELDVRLAGHLVLHERLA